jgi:hypothetical protein
VQTVIGWEVNSVVDLGLLKTPRGCDNRCLLLHFLHELGSRQGFKGDFRNDKTERLDAVVAILLCRIGKQILEKRALLLLARCLVNL